MATPIRRRHEATLAEIKAAARRLMASQGSAAIGLRAVAREMAITPSALYRYVDSRDDLITMMIIDSYNAVGAAVEAAAAKLHGRTGINEFLIVAKAFRVWCLEHPEDFALLYGSPIPGYEVVDDVTNPAAMRVPVVLLSLLSAGLDANTDQLHEAEKLVTPALRKGMAAVSKGKAEMFAGFPPVVIASGLMCWTALLGAVAGEVFHHGPPEITGRTADALFQFTMLRQLSLLGFDV